MEANYRELKDCCGDDWNILDVYGTMGLDFLVRKCLMSGYVRYNIGGVNLLFRIIGGPSLMDKFGC